MSTDGPPGAETKCPRLRWYQYRLRSLFVVMLLVAVGTSYFVVTIAGQRRQGEAAKAIEEAGGWVTVKPTWLGRLLQDHSLVSVTFVSLCETSTTDTELARLQGLHELGRLWLNHTQITDAGLAHLRGLGQLRQLSLVDTRVTDAGLVHLQGLTQLEHLYLKRTKVTDEGVRRLRQALPNCSISE